MKGDRGAEKKLQLYALPRLGTLHDSKKGGRRIATQFDSQSSFSHGTATTIKPSQGNVGLSQFRGHNQSPRVNIYQPQLMLHSFTKPIRLSSFLTVKTTSVSYTQVTWYLRQSLCVLDCLSVLFFMLSLSHLLIVEE